MVVVPVGNWDPVKAHVMPAVDAFSDGWAGNLLLHFSVAFALAAGDVSSEDLPVAALADGDGEM